MYWKDALELILRSNQLWYNDYPEYTEIVSFEDVGKQTGDQAQKDNQSKSTSQAPSITSSPGPPPLLWLSIPANFIQRFVRSQSRVFSLM